jgi:polyhydroxyalkanoate synthesis regulator phasin
MLEMLKKTILVGLGTVTLTRSKVRETLQQLVEQGKITTEEAERMTKELLDSGESELNEFRGQLRDAIQSVLKNMNLAQKDDVEKLLSRMDNLEKRMDFLEDKVARTQPDQPEQPSEDL